MGILDDTLRDADRPLPTRVLRRAMAGEAPAEAPPDEGDGLTLYRLQKHGATTAPLAPPAPRAVEAGAPAARPFHAPVGIVIDASPQYGTSMDGLATGKGQESSRNSDATDRQQSSMSPDSLLRLDYDVATGVSIRSRQTPSPFDNFGNSVQRTDSSDGMRRETGRGAASGDPNNDTVAPAAAMPSPDSAAAISPMPDGTARETPAAVPGEALAAAVASPATPAGAPPRTGRQPASAIAPTSSRPARVVAAPPAVRSPVSARVAADGPPAAARPEPHDTAPRLAIGRIEVTVLGEAKPAPKPRAAADDAFLSKHYLRRL